MQFPQVHLKKKLPEMSEQKGCTATAGKSVLHLAARGGHENIVRLLLLNIVADINVRDTRGWTAMHHACHRGHTAVIELLLRCGTDVNIKTRLPGWMPLHCACGHTAIVELLL